MDWATGRGNLISNLTARTQLSQDFNLWRWVLRCISPLPIISFKHLQRANLQHGLAKIPPRQHPNQPFRSIVHSLGNTHLGLELALRDPLLDILLVVCRVLGTHVWVHDDETLHLDALGNDLHEIFNGVSLGGGKVVLGDHAAGDDAAELLDVSNCCFELFAANLRVVIST